MMRKSPLAFYAMVSAIPFVTLAIASWLNSWHEQLETDNITDEPSRQVTLKAQIAALVNEELPEHERRNAADALAKRGPLAVPEMTEVLETGSNSSRTLALYVLGRVGVDDYESAIPLLAKALQDSSLEVRIAAVNAVPKMIDDDHALLELLTPCLDDEDKAVSKEAFESLAELGEVAVPIFRKYLRSPSIPKRSFASRAIRKSTKESSPYTSEYLEIATSTEYSPAAQNLVGPLLTLKKNDIKVLKQLVRSPQPNVRKTALKFLQFLPEQQRATVLFELLEEDDWRLRYSALQACAKRAKEFDEQ